MPTSQPPIFSLLVIEQKRLTITTYEDIGAAEASYNQALRESDTVAAFLYETRKGLLDYWSKPN